MSDPLRSEFARLGLTVQLYQRPRTRAMRHIVRVDATALCGKNPVNVRLMTDVTQSVEVSQICARCLYAFMRVANPLAWPEETITGASHAD